MTNGKRNILLTVLAAIMCVALVCLAVMFVPSGSNTVLAEETVDHGNHEGYTALTEAGGELQSGNYYLTRDITLTTDITIASGATVTLCLNGYKLTGTGTKSVINSDSTGAGNFVVCDCNGSNGTHKYNIDEETGKYIFTDDGTAGEIKGGVITGGKASNGGGVYGPVTILGGNICGNEATSNGGGIYDEFGSSSSIVLVDGTISGNIAAYGGGIGTRSSGATIDGGMIVNNTATKNGGGLSGASININGGTISGNKAGENGGGISSSGAIQHIKNCTIENNTATIDGGGIYGSYTTYENVVIRNNTATGNGGGLYISYSEVGISISNVTISGNTAVNGAGVYIKYHNADAVLSGLTISDNIATGEGNGIYAAEGGIFSLENVTDDIVNAGTLTIKGGSYTNTIINKSTMTISGGYLYSSIENSGTITITGGYIPNPIGGTVTIQGGYYASGEANSNETVLGMKASDGYHVLRLVEGDEGYNPDFPYTVKSGSAPDTTLTPTVNSVDYDGQALNLEDFAFANQSDIKEFVATYTVKGATEPAEPVEGLPTNAGCNLILWTL